MGEAMKSNSYVETSGIIPPYSLIKQKNLEAFYNSNKLLNRFRLLPNESPYQKMLKANVLIEFKSSLIYLFFMNETTLKEHHKTKEKTYGKLKELSEEFSQDVIGMDFKAALAFLRLLEKSLYDIGLLNIGVSDSDVEERLF